MSVIRPALTQSECERWPVIAKLQPGDTLWTTVRHIAPSGMSRVIDLYIIRENEPLRISWSTAELLQRRYSERYEGVTCQGSGMDMGFELVYSLSQKLFGDGYALKQRWL